jgi:HEAT repeat protein
VQAVHNAMRGDESAVDLLVEFLDTDDVRQDLAKFTALTLVACGLLADRDDSATCLRIVDNALQLLTEESPSVYLCKMLVLQQRALRNNDIGESVAPDLATVRSLIGQVDLDWSPELVLRTGADVTPNAAIENIVDVLKSASAGFGLTLPSFDMGYVTADLEDDQLGNYRRWLDSTFKTKMGRAIPASNGPDQYFENLRLEVIGHREVYRSRRELATMRLIRFIPTLPATVAENGLRLLRLAGADAELRLLVDDLVFAGPMSALLSDGRRIESMRTSDRSLRTGEMIVLAAASEVMDPPEAFKALTRVLSVIRRGGPTTAPMHWHADFSKDEDAWLAAAALAGASGTAGEVARALLDYATPERLTDQSFDLVIARIVRRIEWADVDNDLKQLWLALTDSRTTDGRATYTAEAIISSLTVHTQLPVDEDASLNDVADSLNYYLRTATPFPKDVVESAKRAALSGLTRVAEQATTGKVMGGGVQPAEVLAVLLSQSRDQDAWAGLLDFLANPRVARSAKSRAFDALVSERPFLSRHVASRYADRMALLVTEADRWAFGDPYGSGVFIEALTFAYAYEFLTEESAAEHFRALASSHDAQRRRQVGRYLSLIAKRSVPDWMVSIVFTLSSDSDPRVRYAVTRALGEICRREDVVGGLAIDKLSELLRSEGVYVPLNALSQIGPEALRITQIEHIVGQLRNDSQSWRIRKRAAELLD